MFDRRSLLKLLGFGAATVAVPKGVSEIVEAVEISEAVENKPCAEAVENKPCAVEPEPFDVCIDYTYKKVEPVTPRGGGRIDMKGSTITFRAHEGGKETTIKIGEGNITYTDHCDYEYMFDRGQFDSVHEVGRRTELSIVRGEHVNWISTVRESNLPLDVSIIVDDATYTFNNFYWQSMDYDMTGADFSISGVCEPNV
jgi:hypothetical protein